MFSSHFRAEGSNKITINNIIVKPTQKPNNTKQSAPSFIARGF